MIYAFAQDGQSIEILRHQWESLSSYAQSRDLTIDKWLDSTSFDPELFKAKDVLLLEKTFRLGKDIRTITAIMQDLLQKGVVICSCEDNITFGGDSASSKTMADMLGLVTDIVEELRSRLTKEALTSRKLAEQKLGRPSGSLNKSYKLEEHARELRRLLSVGVPMSKVARKFNVDINTLRRYLKLHPKIKAEKTA